VSKKFKSEVRK